MSPTTAMFWPMIAHVALVFGIYALLNRRRTALRRAGKVTTEQFRELRDEPSESLMVRNNLASQFELPVLFHVACLLLYITDADNIATIVLAWLFIVARYAHTYVHVTSNRLRYRTPAFVVSFVMLGLMWAWLAVWLAFE